MLLKRLWTATIFLLVVPISASLASWLILDAKIVAGQATFTGITETGAAVSLFVFGVLLFFSSLGIFASKNNVDAEKWVRWLRGWRPRWQQGRETSVASGSFRVLAMASILVSLALAILLIPGVGEDRQFPLDQFYGLFGTIWYFYSFTIGIVAVLVLYKKRVGGWILALILGLIPIGTNVPDLLGLLPPSAPTFRTWILLLTTLPPSVTLVYVSWRALHIDAAGMPPGC